MDYNLLNQIVKHVLILIEDHDSRLMVFKLGVCGNRQGVQGGKGQGSFLRTGPNVGGFCEICSFFLLEQMDPQTSDPIHPNQNFKIAEQQTTKGRGFCCKV